MALSPPAPCRVLLITLLAVACGWLQNRADVVVYAAPTSKDASQSAFVETSLRLAEANWTSEIGKGSWFVEFFLPYSTACKAFSLTWQELTSNKEILRTAYPDAPFYLAQVDCSTERDICVREGVTHVPKLSLYRNGVQTESEFQGEREYTELSAFVDAEAASYRRSKGVSDLPQPVQPADQQQAPIGAAPNAAGQHGSNAPAAKPPAVPVQAPPAAPPGQPVQQQPAPLPPPPPAQAAPPPPVPAPPPPPPPPAAIRPQGPNPDGQVLQFGVHEAIKDERTLHDFLSKDAGHGATFVKFFAPWCPHCRAMAGAYNKLGDALRERVNVIEVDCEAHRSVCASYGVQGFPTLRMFNDGESTEYRGLRSFDAMRTWALKAGSASGVREIAASELADIARNDEVFFLYLHEPGTPEHDVDAVAKASRVLLTTPVHVYRSTDPDLVRRYGARLKRGSPRYPTGPASNAMSGFLAFKDHDAGQPTAVYYPSQQTVHTDLITDIGSWLDSERFPTVVEVTGDSFSEVMNNRQNTPVVLAALSDIHHSGRRQGTGTGAAMRDEELRALRELALDWRRRNTAGGDVSNTSKKQTGKRVLFAWIDADRWATAIHKYYKIKSTQMPTLILAVGSRLEYYDLPSRFVDPYAARKQSWLDPEQVFDTLDRIWRGAGPRAKTSRTYLDRGVRETVSSIENLLLWIARHTFLSLCLTIAFIGLLVLYLRHQASYVANHGQRLPSYGKVD